MEGNLEFGLVFEVVFIQCWYKFTFALVNNQLIYNERKYFQWLFI
jgi:hypothetical protein